MANNRCVYQQEYTVSVPKQELLENNLIQENYLFREKVKSMHIVVYGDVAAIYKNAIDKLNEFTDVTYIDIDNSNNYTHDIYECNKDGMRFHMR